MDWIKATNDQLDTIALYDKHLPTHLVGGLVEEMMNRKLWNGTIVFAARHVFKDTKGIMKYVLKIDREELFQIGNMVIAQSANSFVPGKSTLRTFMITCLKHKFTNMVRNARAVKRQGDEIAVEEEIQIFRSTANVEKQVINKIVIEEAWDVLRDIEKKAIQLELQGFTQYEIDDLLGLGKRSSHTLLNRAYAKLRKKMGA